MWSFSVGVSRSRADESCRTWSLHRARSASRSQVTSAANLLRSLIAFSLRAPVRAFVSFGVTRPVGTEKADLPCRGGQQYHSSRQRAIPWNSVVGFSTFGLTGTLESSTTTFTAL